MKDRSVYVEVRNKTSVLTVTTPVCHLTRKLGLYKTRKYIGIGKEDMKYYLFGGDLMCM